MKNNEIKERDEIIEELWEVKDNFARSCGPNVGEIVKKMNKIAESLKFEDIEPTQEQIVKTA